LNTIMPDDFDSQKLRIYPVTRIDGRADIEVLFASGGKVSGARFRALEVRGLEHLVHGMPALRAPQVVSRACGACGPFHQLASCLALEKIAGCVVPEQASRLREVICWLNYGMDHLLNITYHELPDYALPMSDVAVRNVTGMYMVQQEAISGLTGAICAIRDASASLAGACVHPSVIVPGGVASMPDERVVDRAVEALKGCEDDIREAIRLAEMLIKRDEKVMDSVPMQGSMAVLTADGDPSPVGDAVTMKAFAAPSDTIVFSPEDFYASIVKEPVSWSYIVPVAVGDSRPLLVGPLARLNNGFVADTPLAKLESDRVKEQWGEVLDRPLFNFMAVMIEAARAWEKSIALLSEGPFVGDSAAPLEFSGSSGVAVVDSPRGLLLHKLKLSKGSTISSYEIISPLQFNHDMLNDSLSKVALDAVDGLDMDDAVSGRLELIVRSFNPCVSCGTH